MLQLNSIVSFILRAKFWMPIFTFLLERYAGNFYFSKCDHFTDLDKKEYGVDPTIKVETAIASCKEEADKMFFDVLGRKDKADKTRNALTVLNR